MKPSRAFPLTLAALLPVAAAFAAEPPAAPAAHPLEAYAVVGSGFAQNSRLAQLGWTEEQFNAFIEGLRASFRGQPYELTEPARVLHEEIGRRVQQIVADEARTRQEYFTDPARLETYMKDAVKAFQLQRSDSGLAYGLLTRGGGARPGPDDTVVISYSVNAADARTQIPQLAVDHLRAKVSELMPGLAEGLQMMSLEGAAMLILPPDLSYGTGEWPAGTDRGTPLIFTVVLHEVIAAP